MHTADIIIFVAFLAIYLIVGAIARGKNQTFREFAVGNKTFSTATLVATMVAAWASGTKFFIELEGAYSTGLYVMIAILIGVPAGLLVTGYLVAPRMSFFLNYVSVADAMGKIYGKGVQFMAAIGVVFGKIGFTAIQFKIISKVLVPLFNVDAQGDTVTYMTIAVAAIVIFYSAFGGVKAVAFTDMINCTTFGIMLPVLALTIWNNLLDPHLILATLQSNPNFSFSHVLKWDEPFMGTLSLMFYLMTPSLPPELFQRMAMAKDMQQIKRSIAYSVCVIFLIDLLIMWIAILLLTDNPHLKASEVVKYMFDQHVYVGLKGFLGVGVVALAMSTADSVLNSTAVIIANDILPAAGLMKRASVRVASLATFVLGFCAILLALSMQNILEIFFQAANFYFPITTIPILLTIFGFRTTPRVLYIGMGGGAVMTGVLLIYFQNINSFFPGILTNLVFLLGSHYLLGEQGGWIKQARYDTAERETVQSFWKQIKRFQLMPHIQKRLPNEEYYYPLLGFICLQLLIFLCMPYPMKRSRPM